MKKILLVAGIGVIILAGAGCENSSSTSISPTQKAAETPQTTQNQVVDQNGCKASTYKPSDGGLGFSPTDCTFRGFGKQVTPAELDKASCKRISYYVIVDKNRVYKQLYDPGSSNSDQYTILKVDPATFVSLGFDYYKDAKNLYFDNGTGVRTIKGIDLASLEVLSTHYLKDKNHLYSAMPERSDKVTLLNSFDRETFSSSDDEEFMKDKNGIYFLEGKDPSALSGSRSKITGLDKPVVVTDGGVIEGADPFTFEYLGEGFYKDKNNVYTMVGGVHHITGIDGCSFELLGYTGQTNTWRGYSRDKNRVYYYEWVVEGADPTTFRVEGERVFDKNSEYQGRFKKN